MLRLTACGINTERCTKNYLQSFRMSIECCDPERSRGFLCGQAIYLTVVTVDAQVDTHVQPGRYEKIIATGKKQPFYFHRIVGRFIGKAEFNGKTGTGS